MSVFQELLDTFKEVSSDAQEIVSKYTAGKKVSISRVAKRTTLQFPLLMSKAVDPEGAYKVSKALDSEYVNFVRLLTSMYAVTDESDVEGYLKSIHQNMDLNGVNPEQGFYAYLDTEMSESSSMIHDLNESFFNIINTSGTYEIVNIGKDLDRRTATGIATEIKKLDENCKVALNKEGYMFRKKDNLLQECILIRNTETDAVTLTVAPAYPSTTEFRKVNMIQESSKVNALSNELLSEYISPFNTTPINELTKSSSVLLCEAKKRPITNNNITNNYNSTTNRYSVASANNMHTDKVNMNNGTINGIQSKYGNVKDSNIEKFTIEQGDNKFFNNNNIKQGDIKINIDNGKKEPERMIRSNILSDNDIKKNNQLTPTILEVTTHFKDKSGKILRSETYLVGVKTVIHGVSSDSMIDNIPKGVKRGRMLFNLVKYTSGETSFFKDFIFNISDIKDEVKTKYKENKWWSALTRRRNKAKLLMRVNVKEIMPNCTLVLTVEEADVIKNVHKVDLFDKATVNKLMDYYFLLGIVIVDSGLETVHIMLDGDNDYEQLSYSALERESKNTDTKELLRILSMK